MDLVLIPTLLVLIFGLLYVFSSSFLLHINSSLHWIFIIKLTFLILITSKFEWPYDIQGYFNHAKLVWQGQIPLKDFNSPYSIGFEYLMAIGSLNFSTPLFIGIFILGLELACYHILYSIRLMTKGQIFHLAWNPLFLHFTLFDIQDEFLSLFFIAWILFVIKNESNWFLLIFSSILFLFFSKILSILFIVPLYYKNQIKGFFAGFIICLLYTVLYLSDFHIFSYEFEKNGGESDRILDIISSGNIFWIIKFLGLSLKPNISIFVTAGTLILANAYLVKP